MNQQISLLMTNYNNDRYIQESIVSVLNQSFKNWELIIVDDLSTDNSEKVIKNNLKDPRIKFIKHKKNLGYAGSLKTAIDNSRSAVVGIIDSDDALYEDALKIMMKAHGENPDYGLIYSTYWACDKKLNIKDLPNFVGEVDSKITNLKRPRVSHFKTFKKRDYDKTEGFDPKQKKAVDKDLIYKLEEITKLKFIDKPLYYYREHNAGISQGNNIKEAKAYDIIAKYKAYKRRRSTNIPNLSRWEIDELLSEVIDFTKSSNYFDDNLIF